MNGFNIQRNACDSFYVCRHNFLLFHVEHNLHEHGSVFCQPSEVKERTAENINHSGRKSSKQVDHLLKAFDDERKKVKYNPVALFHVRCRYRLHTRDGRQGPRMFRKIPSEANRIMIPKYLRQGHKLTREKVRSDAEKEKQVEWIANNLISFPPL